MAHELEVWLFADRVGTLALVDGRLSFCYAPSWLTHKDAIALSASLPLQTEPLDDRKTRPFFAGLLPEGQMRRLIAQPFRCLTRTTLRCWTTSVANVPGL
ncbi:HipA N-terminal domain-containing protein [Acidithiobacillus sp.]|uniref:HipA N-terminal domain-containing protein n=1 Tax=Acidithiobacillus sp. TaxID=1872118 RepID=UPI0036055B5D